MRLKLASIAAIAAALLAAEARAEGRDNPFTPPPSKVEMQERQDERTRRIIREIVPEIEARVMQGVAASQAASELRLRKRIDEVETVPSVTATAPGDANGTAAAPGVPDGAKFISCVNGKALYRDKDNALFQVSGGSSGVDRCAR